MWHMFSLWHVPRLVGISPTIGNSANLMKGNTMSAKFKVSPQTVRTFMEKILAENGYAPSKTTPEDIAALEHQLAGHYLPKAVVAKAAEWVERDRNEITSGVPGLEGLVGLLGNNGNEPQVY